MLLNIKDSAKFAKVSRSTIYAKLEKGELSKSSDGLIDIAELLRVFGSPDNRDKARKKAQLDAINKTLDDNQNVEMVLLKEKIHLLESSLLDAKNREEWLKSQVDKLTDTIKLLDAPKSKKKK